MSRMMNYWFVGMFVLVIWLTSVGEMAAQNRRSPFEKVMDVPGLSRVMLIGDSISIGYTLTVRDQLKRIANVHRPSENCAGTIHGLKRIDTWLGTGKWDVIHFNWGLHDLKYVDAKNRLTDVAKGKHQSNIEVYEKQLETLVTKLKKTGATLVFATTTPVPEGSKGRVVGDEDKYNAVALRVMKKHGITVNDLNARVRGLADDCKRKANVHYTTRGSQRLGEHVAAVIRHALGEPMRIEPVPTPQQLDWMRMEMTMFLHFGVNTFTNREWGDGKENPNLFNPSELDCRQWVREAKAAGFKMMILTAKHHDGFCLWPSKFTDHSVKSSQWHNGKGDVMKEFVAACKAEGMKAGFYLSPWDRHDLRYGGQAYNDYFKKQLDELMKTYRPIDEVWFDGASKGKITPYDWKGFYDVVYRRNPRAVIAICGPDIRWVGNESGVARTGESSVQIASKVRHFGQSGKVWYPAECDVSIRPGWFYHASQDKQVKSVEHLLDIYFKSVGRNSVLLLNVPPNKKGQFSEYDVKCLREFRKALDEIFKTNLVAGCKATATNTRGNDLRFVVNNVTDDNLETYWASDDGVTKSTLEIDLGSAKKINVINVQEYLPLGERVSKYRIEARVDDQWQILARGTVIGHKNLHRTRTVMADRLRLVIEQGKTCGAIAELGAYYSDQIQTTASGSVAAHKPVKASDVHPGGTSYGGDKAIDDDPRTRWATADSTRKCWLEVDLGKAMAVGRIKVVEFDSRITKFQLEYRNDVGKPWKVAMKGGQVGPKYSAKFNTVQARYVRLHILEATFAPTIWEFQIFSPTLRGK